MNEREGRIGKREGASLVLICCIISGLFALDTTTAYAHGNSQYASDLLSALLAYLLFLIACTAMKKAGINHLYELYRMALGRWIGSFFSVVSALALLIAATQPLARVFLIMCRYVYTGAPVENVALYFVPCIVFLMWKGLETLGRTAKLFAISTVFSLALAFLIAIPAYESYRLFPLLGNGIPAMLKNAVIGVERYFPALMALLICGKGVQGIDCAAQEGGAGALAAGGFTAGSQVCLGLTYPYWGLAKMHSPMYRTTMSLRMGSFYLRTDKVLLFFWTVAAMIASSFYGYAAALLYCRTFSIRDIRPVAALMAGVIAAFMLMAQENYLWYERAGEFITDYLFVFLISPVLLSSGIALFRRGREVSA